jgi:DNA-directed RNA polymerase specialized sigma24 family protein
MRGSTSPPSSGSRRAASSQSEIQGYVQSIVRDRHEAEDITHSVFAKLISAIARYEPREAPFARAASAR